MLISANWFIAAHSMKRLMTKERFLDLRDEHLMIIKLCVFVMEIANKHDGDNTNNIFVMT